MIVDTLVNYKRYIHLHPEMEAGFQTIEKCLSRPLPAESRHIEVDGVPVVLQYYQTKAYTEKKFEGHRKCIDIQFMVKGKETIYWADSAETMPVSDYNAEHDHLSYADTEANTPLHLKTGYFAVFLPGEAHKTGCAWDQTEEVEKLIIKIKL